MQCPHCGSEDLLPRFKFCPECSLPLPFAPIKPKGREDVGGKSNKQQSRSTFGENTATDTEDPQLLTSQNQGAGNYNNETISVNTNQYQSTTYQSQGAGKHGEEEPSTKAGQQRPSSSQNQGAGKYDDQLLSSKSGQHPLLKSQNQGTSKYCDEVPSTTVDQQDPLFSQNPEVGKGSGEVRPKNTNQQKPLLVQNQCPGKNVDEVPSTNAVHKQPISSLGQGANNHSNEVPSLKTGQKSPSTNQVRKAVEPSFESSGHPNTGKCQTTVGETEEKFEGSERSECTNTSTIVSGQKAEAGNGRCMTSSSTQIIKANSSNKTTEAGSPEGHGLSYINEEHSHAIDEENLRCPALLDENNSNLPSPPTSRTSGQEQDQTVETHLDSQQVQSSYQHKQEDKGNGIEEKKLANSGQSSSQAEAAATHMRSDRPTTGYSTLPKESQQKPPEANNLPDLAQDHEKNETLQNSVEVSKGPVTREQSKRNQQRNLSMSSEAGAATGTDVSCDPLGGSQDNDRRQSKEDHGAEPSGNWYRKSDAQELETKGKKGKKDKKGNVGNSELQASKALPAPSLQQVPPENGVTVVFHVLLASSFKMADASLFIRAHGEDLGNFEQNCVDMAAVAESEQYKDKDKLLYFRGQFTISLDRAHKGTFYKYLVVRKGRQFYEELLEFPPFHYNAIVDRVLKIREKDIKTGATWNQIDGVAYVSNDEGIFSWLWSSNSFSKYETLEYRTRALYFFLPKWEGFVVDGRTEKMDATEALSKLNNVVSCLSNVWTREKGNIKLRKPNNFHESKALIDYFTRKMLANFEVLKNCNAGSRQHASAVVSSLAIILIVEKYKIDLKREEISLLLRCLALDADPMEKKCSVYEAVLAEFSHGLRNYAAEAIENLCNLLIKQAWGSNSEWLLAVPLLHFLRDESKPFEEPDMTGWPKTMAWWGAEKLRIREFRVSATATKDFSQMWPLLESAFEVDRLFKRTFLRAIPVWKLSEVVSTGIFHVSDICIALVSFFPASLMAKEMVKIVEECMKAMIIILETKEDRYPIEITEFTVNVSLELTTTCIERISLRSDVETVCLSIQLLFLSINKFRESDQNQSQERESLIGNITDRLLERLGKKIGVHFKYEMDKTYIERELQVWSKLLSAANGFLGIEGYRTQLTQQFVNRASRVKSNLVIKTYNRTLYSPTTRQSILIRVYCTSVYSAVCSRHA
ncbi:E3 ubiquitin-protein ligase rnf213-alpha-like isoform X2 [Montipora capricornis]|uniref:E3 ubiquitin-protein ligase rnf213-alpha-like isoform X2 n=1 Tax=Montipora capricornis TaxID=246305 RepID=UPI0035F101D6